MLGRMPAAALLPLLIVVLQCLFFDYATASDADAELESETDASTSTNSTADAAAQKGMLEAVVQQMDKMRDKALDEFATSQVEYAKFLGYCASGAEKLDSSIKRGEIKAQEQEALINQAVKNVEKLDKDIGKLRVRITELGQEKKENEQIREKEKADFDSAMATVEDGMLRMRRATTVLRRKMGQANDKEARAKEAEALEHAAAQAAAHAKNKAEEKAAAEKKKKEEEEKKKKEDEKKDEFLLSQEDAEDDSEDDSEGDSEDDEVDPLLQQVDAIVQTLGGDSFLQDGAPKRDGLEVPLQMIEKLKDQFEAKKDKLKRDDHKAQLAHMQIMLNLNNQIKMAEELIKQKQDQKMAIIIENAKRKADLKLLQNQIEADRRELMSMRNECIHKAAEFQKDQLLLKEEAEALKTAKGIIVENENLQNTNKNHVAMVETAVFLQMRSETAASLAQLRGMSSEKQEREIRKRLVAFLTSGALAKTSERIRLVARRAEIDPIERIEKIIKELLMKLEQEYSDMTTQAAYCKKELEINKLTRDQKTEQLSDLNEQIDRVNNTITVLTEELQELTQTVRETKDRLFNITQLREEEKARNEQVIEDAQEAQKTCQKALKVLRDFYETRAKQVRNALIQESEGGQEQDSSGSKTKNGMVVIAMMEALMGDFSKLEVQTKSAEEQQYMDFKAMETNLKSVIQVTGVDIEHKTKEKEELEAEFDHARQDRRQCKRELNAANLYYEGLKPMCVDMGPSYEERQQTRREEIKSLQGALELLNFDFR